MPTASGHGYAPPMRSHSVNVPRLVVFVLVMGGAVIAALAGHFGAYVLAVLLISVVLFLAAAIFAGFVSEVGKIFKR